MSRRKAKKTGHRRNRRQGSAQTALLQRMEKRLPNQDVLVTQSEDGVKMSEVLERFVEPYREIAETQDAYKRLLALALVAWNMTLIPKKERTAAMEESLFALPEEMRSDGRQLIRHLMVRKETSFSQYRRMILDFELVDTGSEWHLSVVSSLKPLSGQSYGEKKRGATSESIHHLIDGWRRLAGSVRDFMIRLRNR